MDIKIRRATPGDAVELGRICYEAFGTLAEHHRFPSDFPSAGVATHVMSMLISHPGFYGILGEVDGRIIGSNFLDERSTIAGVGPISIDPAWQDKSAGRMLMVAVLQRAHEKAFPGVRLVQAAYHNRSLSLYAKLGFQVREPLACMQGPALQTEAKGYQVRAATDADIAVCNRLCFAIHGHERSGELRDGVEHGSARVVERDGRVTGYASLLGFFGHAVGMANEDLEALIGGANEFQGPGLLVPLRNGDLFAWCLDRGLRVTQPLTLMTMGMYNEPAGAFLPSILY
ncbi:MAG TPA: GNAT family N-acetyltransferase [Terriglobia bacterium]|nr:GNAT family N-acetyltransferase [Terriglobia bacterium]